MVLDGNVGEYGPVTGDGRRDDALKVTDVPRRGANYVHYPILSRSSLSYVSSHATDIAGDDRRKIKRRYRNGYACPSHVPYRQLGQVDLKLGDRDIRLSHRESKPKSEQKVWKGIDGNSGSSITDKIVKSQRLFLGDEDSNSNENKRNRIKSGKNTGSGVHQVHQDLFPTQLGRFNSGAWRRTRVLYTRKRGVDKRLRRDIHSAHRRVTESRANAVQGILSNHITNCRVKSTPVAKKEVIERNEEFDSDDEQYYDEDESSEDKNVPHTKSNGTRKAVKTEMDGYNNAIVTNTHDPFHEGYAKKLRSNHFEEENDLENDVDILRKKNDKAGNKEHVSKYDHLTYLPYQSRVLSPRPVKVLSLDEYQNASRNGSTFKGRAPSGPESRTKVRGRRRSNTRNIFDLPPGSTMIPISSHERAQIHKRFEKRLNCQLDRSHLHLVRPRKEGDDDSNADVTPPAPGLPNLKSLRPVNKLRAAADDFSNVRNDLDEKLEKVLVILKSDRPETLQRKYKQLSSGLHAINWRKEIESIRLAAEMERLTNNVEMHKKVSWFYSFLRDYIEHKELVNTGDATSFNSNNNDSKFTNVEIFVISFIHRVLEHKQVFDDQKLQLLKDHLKPNEVEETIALVRILHQNCKTLSQEHYQQTA